MPEEEKKQKLIDLITPETTEDELKKLVGKFLTSEEEELLGGKEVAAQKVADSFAYMGAFQPAPATFDKAAFAAVAALGLPNSEVDSLFEINLRMGIFKPENKAPISGERFSISSESVNAAKQFLTE